MLFRYKKFQQLFLFLEIVLSVFAGSAVNSEVNILICAEVFCDRDAVEVLADLTVMDGSDVEEEKESDKEKDDARQTYNDL
jgi:hypothetical protein